MDVETSPLAVLSLIVAPAVLTNASTVLAMSTSNRLARATDRARELARQLEGAPDMSAAQPARRLRELASAERRSLMLLAALRSVYVALGGFACAALFALLGAVLSSLDAHATSRPLALLGVAAGLVALAALLHGSIMLVRETRLVVEVLQERAAEIRARGRAGPG
jgi:Protein of unknown function (DUF2721)